MDLRILFSFADSEIEKLYYEGVGVKQLSTF